MRPPCRWSVPAPSAGTGRAARSRRPSRGPGVRWLSGTALAWSLVRPGAIGGTGPVAETYAAETRSCRPVFIGAVPSAAPCCSGLFYRAECVLIRAGGRWIVRGPTQLRRPDNPGPGQRLPGSKASGDSGHEQPEDQHRPEGAEQVADDQSRHGLAVTAVAAQRYLLARD